LLESVRTKNPLKTHCFEVENNPDVLNRILGESSKKDKFSIPKTQFITTTTTTTTTSTTTTLPPTTTEEPTTTLPPTTTTSVLNTTAWTSTSTTTGSKRKIFDKFYMSLSRRYNNQKAFKEGTEKTEEASKGLT
jgi:hypothetical protein